MTRIITCDEITRAVADLCRQANYYLGEDVRGALEGALAREVSPQGKDVLNQLLENAAIAAAEEVPICQDTGVAVVFLELGQEVQVQGGYLYDAINAGVRQGYTEGYLRKSMVYPPLDGRNTGDNTPAIIHTEIVPGDKLTITVAPKGGGSENMSAAVMLAPAAGIRGVKEFVLETVKKAGPNPCPPLIVGVGIGGNFEKCALLAKKALLRPLGEPHPLEGIATLERDLLESINCLGIGPGGFGGRMTALAVHVEIFARHIASLPVAVNIQCHAARHKSITL
ncbi:fumarate hydratase [Neomoorella thermoacetica]|uniref:Fumarase alpha subunit n=1 Tax=Moorella thermoacetica (strain ATCC 39073 / JCM 9320) TaxID=264732 RepID=Q2RG69_MOOTA|nr:fumarate hydratase [Moorella thermoacetica]AKX95136.1 L(+)-tartrate dehydratase subunit alpha [Moorella thermoacetica]AKX97761.1 L(+)-tartrate dehydratase subunit alpha [Moorella thermoacetica]OIQ52915.1 L(+)-tartrate dehydratase subunit alpha [Moorella thermoacetica]OIQ56592.1 L(+)-tartrate dehydratase subunit alpha [Moorella thermoacetica]QDA01581.1 L(+)-tartrate dehydratase subunit alpha [Moorella thermoacetica]